MRHPAVISSAHWRSIESWIQSYRLITVQRIRYRKQSRIYKRSAKHVLSRRTCVCVSYCAHLMKPNILLLHRPIDARNSTLTVIHIFDGKISLSFQVNNFFFFFFTTFLASSIEIWIFSSSNYCSTTNHTYEETNDLNNDC